MNTTKKELRDRLTAIAKLCILEEESAADLQAINRHITNAVLNERARCIDHIRSWSKRGDSVRDLLACIEGIES